MNTKKTSEDYTGRIKTRFIELLGEKQAREGKRITYRQIREDTGISTTTLSAYAQNKPSVKAFKKSTIAGLCNFFDCEVGELIVYERKKPVELKTHAKTGSE